MPPIQTKIERYCAKFINNHYSKSDKKKPESLKFEWFVSSMHAWYYASQSYNSKQDIGKEISLGNAQGGDAFFITVNNQLFSLQDDVKTIIDVLKKNKGKVIFHLVQVKKSSHVKLGDFKNFTDIPLKIFKNTGISSSQPRLAALKEFVSTIIESNDLQDISHEFELSFYTEKNENDIEKLKKEWCDEIEFIKNDYNEYTNVKINIRGADFINDVYERFIANDLVLFVDKSNLTFVDDNKYLIGFLSADELLNCITTSNKETHERILHTDVFVNNIRLYLGSTPINVSIEKTLHEEPENFHLYNNGLTITTKKIGRGHAHLYRITPVNIVNGCQTANSIYNVFRTKSEQEKKVKIPVRIIVAQDDEYEKITIRTNSQNGLSEQDLISITNVQKDLEDDFRKLSIQGYSFFYKRQNSANVDTNGVDFIIKIDDILRASFSCLMLIPHKVLGCFDTTTDKFVNSIFEERFLKIYPVLTVLLKLVTNELEDKYSPHIKLKYHITYLIYKLCTRRGVDKTAKSIAEYFSNKSTTGLSSEDVEKFVDSTYKNIYSVINDGDAFAKIIKYIFTVLKKDYPMLVNNITTKEWARILYKTVDKSQLGEAVFKNIDQTFTKDIHDFVPDV
ncbi:MAG: AIPR family protein [Planctomycetaceae bacterium]|jgi:hypothetical protein|nr:AIPR family protein [Planctomycetaceae bacterium]